MKTLLSRPTGTEPSTLEDLLLCVAATIEDSLIQAGADPEKDYSRLDLYKLAQPFVVHIFKTSKQPEITFCDRWTQP